VVSKGSALKFCLVAEGAADLYPRLGPTMEWDTAAAQCIVEQAGGQVTTLTQESLQYNKENLLNPFFMVASPATASLWMPSLHDITGTS
jgi:3'(2'), 5'-bisphosphate nucleotidase